MPVVMVHVQVKDFDAWKAVFDSTAGLRSANGFTSTRVLRSADDANDVIIESETHDLAKAKQFLTSPEMRETMVKAGVLGPPTMHFLDVP